jgi:excisionase family DNA binding protein
MTDGYGESWKVFQADGTYVERLVISINDTARALGIGRSSVYGLIKAEKLDAIKIGTRTLITTASVSRLAQPRRAAHP